MKFSATTLLGFFICFTVLMVGALDTVGAVPLTKNLPGWLQIPFLDFASLFVVLGGLLTGLFIMYPAHTVLSAIGSLRYVFSHYNSKTELLEEEIKNILKYRSAYANDKNNFFAANKPSDSMTKYMFELVSTNYSAREIRDMADLYIDKRAGEEKKKADVLQMMANTAPSFGMVGTLLGLIIMLGNLEDPSKVGPALALALLTTLYGVGFANLLFSPMAKKIKYNQSINQTREKLIMEGIVLIREGKSELLIKDQLGSLIGQGGS